MESDSESKWVICRICLKTGTEMMKIFEDDEQNLLAKIEECGGVELDTTADLPDSICSKCLTLLKAATKFRTICQRTQAALQRQFGTKDLVRKEEEKVEQPSLTNEFPEEFLKFKKKDEDEDDMLIETRVLETTPTTAVEAINESNFITEDCMDAAYDLEDISHEPNDDCLIGDNVGFELIKEEVRLDEYSEQEQEQEMVEYVLQIDGDQNDGNFKIIPQTKEKPLPVSPTPVARSISLPKTTATTTARQKRKNISIEVYQNADGVFECPKCDNVYINKHKLIAHLRMHNQDKPHECEICFKRFSQTPQLARHMNTHTGQRPFQCTYCPASFADPSTRIKHIRTHTNERPYKCEVCGKSFTYSNVLKVHQMIHTGEKPFSCKFCNKKFSQAHHRKNHERTHLSDKKISIVSD